MKVKKSEPKPGDVVTVYAIDVTPSYGADKPARVELHAATAEVKKKTVRLLNRADLGAFGHRRVLPLEEAHFTAQEAIDAWRKPLARELARLQQLLKTPIKDCTNQG